MALPAGTGLLAADEDYQLLGLGVRTVSFLGIEVYVVGLYVAKSDLSRLQEQLVKASVGSNASALVKGEKDNLRRELLSGEGSERIWGEVLRECGVRSAVRIVPVKNTNFAHLRDGWIRGIDARGKDLAKDEQFQRAVADFKGLMGGQGSVAKGRVLMLGRDQVGGLHAWVEDGAATPRLADDKTLISRSEHLSSLGAVADERVSRLVWLGYLSGTSPASETARQSVVEGVIDIVERPIGTVETQVI